MPPPPPPPPPPTNKDTPPFHCNEFNYMSSATVVACAGLDLLYITLDTYPMAKTIAEVFAASKKCMCQ